MEQYFMVAEAGGKMAGFASLNSENYLDVFYVSKDFQRMGIASQLFDALLIKAVGHPFQVMTADVSKTAKPFFEKNGFIVCQQQENWIQGVMIPNFRMEKKLT